VARVKTFPVRERKNHFALLLLLLLLLQPRHLKQQVKKS
jgi:hypothetical protein